MDSLKELTDFIKTRSDGVSFSDLRDVFKNEDEIKNFIKSGLDLEVISKTGAKRGTRYFVGEVPQNIVISKSEDNNDTDLEHNDIEVYLKSDKPLCTVVVVPSRVYFGEFGPSIKKFLQSGMVIVNKFVQYDKLQKKNVLFHTEEMKLYNKISFRKEGREFMFIKYDVKNSGKPENVYNIYGQPFKSYEEFREYVRANLI